ncbi:MAG TPA: M20/M25/M40 family metallo-hydrolase [Spirochaetota bacterium]
MSVRDLYPHMQDFLQHMIRHQSISGGEGEFTRFIGAWAQEQGFVTDLFEIQPSKPERFFISPPKHLPLPGRPALVISIPGSRTGRNLIFNAHSDTVSVGEEGDWTVPPFSGLIRDGRVYGRGACDDKGPLVAALWAMAAIHRNNPLGMLGNVFLELVPGEEDCVGVGTLGCIDRGYKADASIILEPTEGIPRCASRGGMRFIITCKGKAIHGTVKWLEKDAIKSMRKVLDALDEMEMRWNDHTVDPLFNTYPFARPITVDKVYGGKWQGMVCDHCVCEGYLELLPDDNLLNWQGKFSRELKAIVGDETIDVVFTENYLGHRTPVDNDFCNVVELVMNKTRKISELEWGGWSAFNSGCESGVRAKLHGSPTIVWGPGSVERAHAPDEFVDFESVASCAELFARTAISWLNE